MPNLTDLLPRTEELTLTKEQIGWAEEEIEAARARHPGQDDLLYHCFTLLQPTAARMTTEWVYRAHCRELLDRVAADGDPREATDAEVASVCCQVSLRVPLNSAAVTVYMRAWASAFPDQLAITDLGLDHYEHVAGGRAEELDRLARHRLHQPQRMLPAISCPGRHHGQPRPDCRFAAQHVNSPRRATG